MMNVARISIVILSMFSICGTAYSRAIFNHQDNSNTEEKTHTLRKRSAELDLGSKAAKDKQIQRRQLAIWGLLNNIDSSGLEYETESPPAVVDPTVTTETRGGHGSGSGRNRRRGRKGRKNKKNRRNNKKNRRERNRKNRGRKSRGRRSLVEAITLMVESKVGDDVVAAIAAVIQPDIEYSGEISRAAKIVRDSAKKCECKNQA